MKTSMKFQLAATMLAVSVGVHSNVSAAGVLYADPSQNIDLSSGDYFFAGSHSAGTSFLDQLQFSLDVPGNIVADVNNAAIPLPAGAGSGPAFFDNQLLMISLFDDHGNFIAAAGTNGELSAAGLSSGKTYTLAVSGKASGIFGGVYDGKVNVDPPAVPLPSALPGFAAALLALGARRRKDGTDKKEK